MIFASLLIDLPLRIVTLTQLYMLKHWMKIIRLYKQKTVLLIIMLFTISISTTACTSAILMPLGATTAGVVASEERSVKNNVSDKVLLTRIKAVFTGEDINHILFNVTVNVVEGRVMLTGRVEEERYKERAEKFTWGIKDVKEVINEIQVMSKARGGKEGQNDLWIQKQIQAKLLFEKDVRSANYDVDVTNGIAYVLGIAGNEEELETILTVISRVKGVKKVINHVISKDDPRRHLKS